MRAQTGAFSTVVSHDSACEEQLPITEGVASTAAPFQGMSNIERELSARALRRRGAISSEGPECSIHGHAIARVAPDGPLLTASQPPSNRLEENSGVDLVDESYSINEPKNLRQKSFMLIGHVRAKRPYGRRAAGVAHAWASLPAPRILSGSPHASSREIRFGPHSHTIGNG